MKHYEEIANRVLKRRDEYVTRQKQKRQTVLKITSVTCAFALVAMAGIGVWWFGGQSAAPVAEGDAAKAPTVTTAPTENEGPGIGGDGDECLVHSSYYHVAMGHFPTEMKKAFRESLGENYEDEDMNIRDFVRFHGITREEFIESMNGMWTEDNLDEIAWNHGNGCPYTKNQFLDAVFGDDPELITWVFAPESTWPSAECWDLLGEDMETELGDWPPEGYGFGETRPVDEEG